MWNNMAITEKNLKIADEIVDVLIREKCTVAQAEGILSEVSKGVRRCGTVQKVNYYETFKDDVSEQQGQS
jgi:hypothetical protein